MTKPTIDEQLDKILYGYSGAHAKDDGQMDFYDSEDEYGEALFAAHTEAKQALTSLIKELVAEAKPEYQAFTRDMVSRGEVKRTIDEFEQNLLKALEEK